MVNLIYSTGPPSIAWPSVYVLFSCRWCEVLVKRVTSCPLLRAIICFRKLVNQERLCSCDRNVNKSIVLKYIKSFLQSVCLRMVCCCFVSTFLFCTFTWPQHQIVHLIINTCHPLFVLHPVSLKLDEPPPQKPMMLVRTPELSRFMLFTHGPLPL